jgi:hypothetical protein
VQLLCAILAPCRSVMLAFGHRLHAEDVVSAIVPDVDTKRKVSLGRHPGALARP